MSSRVVSVCRTLDPLLAQVMEGGGQDVEIGEGGRRTGDEGRTTDSPAEGWPRLGTSDKAEQRWVRTWCHPFLHSYSRGHPQRWMVGLQDSAFPGIIRYVMTMVGSLSCHFCHLAQG